GQSREDRAKPATTPRQATRSRRRPGTIESRGNGGTPRQEPLRNMAEAKPASRSDALRRQFRRVMTQIAKRVMPRPSRQRSRSGSTGGLLRRLMLKLTGRTFQVAAFHQEQLFECETLTWLRSWEIDAMQSSNAMIDEPIRNVRHIRECTFPSSIST